MVVKFQHLLVVSIDTLTTLANPKLSNCSIVAHRYGRSLSSGFGPLRPYRLVKFVQRFYMSPEAEFLFLMFLLGLSKGTTHLTPTTGKFLGFVHSEARKSRSSDWQFLKPMRSLKKQFYTSNCLYVLARIAQTNWLMLWKNPITIPSHFQKKKTCLKTCPFTPPED